MKSDRPYESYATFMSLKLHFASGNYCAVRYNFKSSANPAAFYKRRDKYFFAKVANKYKDLKGFYISQFINGIDYVGSMLDETGDQHYKNYQKIHQSIHASFKKDISYLANEFDTFDEMLVCKDKQQPAIVPLYIQGAVALETVVILNNLTRFTDRADKEITETLSWPDRTRLINKYGKLLDSYDAKQCKDIIIKGWT